MKVSIIVPIYNSERFLDKNISSILNQTFSDFELILVDDKSLDKSFEICQKYAKQDSRIKLIQMEVNSGAGLTRNAGISASKGEYIMFLDPDDSYSVDIVEKLYKAISDNDSDVAVCGYDTHVEDSKINENIKFIPSDYIKPQYKTANDFFANVFPEGMAGYVWNKIYRAGLIKEAGVRFPNMKRLEDGIFNIEFFKRAKSISFVNDVLYHYRLSSQIEGFTKNPPEYCELINEMTEEFLEYQESLNYSNPKKIYEFYLNEIVTCAENSLSKSWGLFHSQRILYLSLLSEDETLDKALSYGIDLGGYRKKAISLLKRKKYNQLLVFISIKITLKKHFKNLFYLIKKKIK